MLLVLFTCVLLSSLLSKFSEYVGLLNIKRDEILNE